MADLTMRNMGVVLGENRAEGRSALEAVGLAGRSVLRGLRSIVAAMEPAESGARFLRWGLDRETMHVPR